MENTGFRRQLWLNHYYSKQGNYQLRRGKFNTRRSLYMTRLRDRRKQRETLKRLLKNK